MQHPIANSHTKTPAPQLRRKRARKPAPDARSVDERFAEVYEGFEDHSDNVECLERQVAELKKTVALLVRQMDQAYEEICELGGYQ